MKRGYLIFGLIVLPLLSILVLTPAPVHTAPALGNSFLGMEYTIYLYNTDVGTTTISFEENLSLVIAAYDGFGLYLPLGNLFLGFYWSPKYYEDDDICLFFNGMVVSDFIGGWGLVLHNYKFTGIFFYFGSAG